MLEPYCYQASRPAQWPNIMSPKKVGKFGYTWRDRGIAVEGEEMNKWECSEADPILHECFERDPEQEMMLSLSSIIPDAWKGKAIYG